MRNFILAVLIIVNVIYTFSSISSVDSTYLQLQAEYSDVLYTQLMYNIFYALLHLITVGCGLILWISGDQTIILHEEKKQT